MIVFARRFLGAAFFGAARAATFDLSTATIRDLNATFDVGALTSEKLIRLVVERPPLPGETFSY